MFKLGPLTRNETAVIPTARWRRLKLAHLQSSRAVKKRSSFLISRRGECMPGLDLLRAERCLNYCSNPHRRSPPSRSASLRASWRAKVAAQLLFHHPRRLLSPGSLGEALASACLVLTEIPFSFCLHKPFLPIGHRKRTVKLSSRYSGALSRPTERRSHIYHTGTLY